MTSISSPLTDDAQKIVGSALQDALVDLLDLSLVGKQAHWTLVGKQFRSIHLQLDEVVDAAREYSDTVAERAAAVGFPPDGSARAITQGSGVPQLSGGWQRDADVVAHFVAALRSVIERMRERISVTDEPDPVSQDLFIQITAVLEKQYWMFQAEQA